MLGLRKHTNLTVSSFAALQSVWPDTLTSTGGLLLVRVANRRDEGDEDVLVRVLVFCESDGIQPKPWLGRLTIRGMNLQLIDKHDENSFSEDYANMYLDLLKQAVALPVVTLPEC